MRYPFFRIISLLSMFLLFGLAWLWINRPSPLALQKSDAVSLYHFDVQALKVSQPVAPDSAEARRRPLFAPDRRPFVPAPPPPAIPTPPSISVVEAATPDTPASQIEPAIPVLPPRPLPDLSAQVSDLPEQSQMAAPIRIEDAGLHLKGIFFNGNARSALINSSQEPAGRWLKAGESVAGWEVVRVEKNKVILRFGVIVASLQLYVDKPAN